MSVNFNELLPLQATFAKDKEVVPLGIDQRFADEQPVSKRFYKRKFRQRLNGEKRKVRIKSRVVQRQFIKT
jgi:hypothetical protein